MLSGCDKLPLTPRDVMEAANPLGVPVKEKVRDVEGGTLFRWTVEARREASWGQAMGAIRREFEYRCPDGQMARDERYSPSLDTSECPDAFRFSYLSLGVQPQTVANENTPDAYLVFLVDCTDGLRSDPWPPGEPAS